MRAGRLILLLLVSAGMAQQTAPVPESVMDILRFDGYWFRYMHDALGCPGTYAQPVPSGSCNYRQGRVNASDFAHARELAMKLFALEGKKHS